MRAPSCTVAAGLLARASPQIAAPRGVTCTGARACLAAARGAPRRQRRAQERASGMYRLSAIYFARSAADLPLDFAIPTIFILIVYLMGHLRYTAAAFFANYFTVLLLALVRGAAAFGVGCGGGGGHGNRSRATPLIRPGRLDAPPFRTRRRPDRSCYYRCRAAGYTACGH